MLTVENERPQLLSVWHYLDFERVNLEHPATLFLLVLLALEHCEGENGAYSGSFLYHIPSSICIRGSDDSVSGTENTAYFP